MTKLLIAASSPLAPFVLACLFTTACNGTCETVESTGRSSADIRVGCSANLVAIERDAGESPAYGGTVTDVMTQFPTLGPGPHPQVRCIDVVLYGMAVRLDFDCPRSVGTYSLDELRAIACDTACGPVAGTIVVTSIALPCGHGGCGRIDADLALAAPAQDSTGPSLTGSAHLKYRETVTEHSCSSGLSAG